MDNRDWSFCARYIDRALEGVKGEIWNGLLSLQNTKSMEIDKEIGFGNCPSCGKFFDPEHVRRKPKFCEECGQAFDWEGQK